MAMTYLEKMKQNQSQQTPQQGLRGVSENTQTQMAKYQNGYQPTEQVQQAQQNLQTMQQQKPQSYSSKWSGALDNILQQIQNPGEFKYSLDGDNMFQYYKDLYTQKAKQGAQNTMGVAAGLTGGYGNSWAQSAGAQAYQQNLLPLYDKATEFMQMAQDRYNADRADRYNRLAALQNAEESEYGRYRDTVSDYNADLDRAREDARYAEQMGYQQYQDMLNYWQNQAAAENADYQAGQEMDYRYNTLDEEARQADQNEAFRNKQLDWQMDTDARDYAESVRQYNANMAENQRQFDTSMEQNAQQFAETNKLDWANLEEKKRQYDTGLTEEQRQYNQDYAMKLCSAILANGQTPSNELLVMAGLSYEDAQKLIAKKSSGAPKVKDDKIAEQIANAVTVGIGPGAATILGLGADYEQMAKEAAAIAETYPEGSAERKMYEEDAKQLSGISEAKDKAIYQWQNGKQDDAAISAYIKMLVGE